MTYTIFMYRKNCTNKNEKIYAQKIFSVKWDEKKKIIVKLDFKNKYNVCVGSYI